MPRLTVLYDPTCGLCRRSHEWLVQQRKLVELVFVPCKSTEARQRFPRLDHELTSKDLTVVGEHGEVYMGPKAWLMVLWALSQYREWAYRLSPRAFADHPPGGITNLAKSLPDQPGCRTGKIKAR